MPCESCTAQFTILKRKKCCAECRRNYCKPCLVKKQETLICQKCVIFTKRPLLKVDLANLKSKDLILYLQSKHISTSGCVEKDELINLIIAHVNYTDSPDRNMYFGSNHSSTGSPGSGLGPQNSAENCSNPFDQIKNTCQTLFNTFTEKLASDFQKPQNFDPRATSSAPNSQNIYNQPRFGSQNINNNNIKVPNSSSEQSIRITVVPSQNSASTSAAATINNDLDDDAGSGITSGADSSVNSSSFSSPAHDRNNIPTLEPSTCPKTFNHSNINARIDSIFSFESKNGCDCSDDEQVQDYKTKMKSLSHDNLINFEKDQAGPSSVKTSKSVHKIVLDKTKPNTVSSSLEELVPESVAVPTTTTSNNEIDVALSTDTENWQIITSNASDSNVTPSDPPPNATENLSGSRTDENLAIPVRISRRRSDSALISNLNNEFIRTHSNIVEEACAQCDKCGKRKSGIKRHLKRIRKQMESCSVSDEEKRRQLENFLSELERRSKNSFDFSDSESLTEDISLDGAKGYASTSSKSQEMVLRDLQDMEDDGIYVYATGNLNLVDMHHIKLSDITSSADLDILSVKQLKEILMLNRVDFKGCCEKAELRERVLRLWRDFKSIPSIEKLPTDDLCKICMDAPIECVILECGHMTTCTQCGKVLSECPICRQYIVRVVRFFRA